MDNAIYIVFSATPTKMGRAIRVATRHKYNHVSLSLSRDIRRLYSFARYHQTTPFYGGFVAESILRYQSFAGNARVKICRIPMEEPQLTYLHNYVERLWNDRWEYIYNTPGALASLFHLRLYIPKTHTCATFVHDILVRYGLAGARPKVCPSVRSLERLLEDYVVYEGSMPASVPEEDWGEDNFWRETTTRYRVFCTTRHFGRLARRVVQGAV